MAVLPISSVYGGRVIGAYGCLSFALAQHAPTMIAQTPRSHPVYYAPFLLPLLCHLLSLEF